MPTFIQAEDNTLGAADAARRTVLYVEDHPVNVLLMQALFAKRPELRLLVAVNGEQGLRMASAERPELLLLDLCLPDCHGTDLLQRMRTLDHLREVTAVAVTAEGASDLSGHGFREVWHKPMDMRATLMRLDWLLAQPDIERSQALRTEVPAESGWAWGAQGRRNVPEPVPPFPVHRAATPQPTEIHP